MNCPQCGGPMWDNRNDKRNPKSPDYKCKNKSCGHAIWEQKQQGVGQLARAAGNGAKWTWTSLSKTYERSLLLAEKHVPTMAKRTNLTATTADVLSAAATIFIAASRDGVQADAPATPPPPPQPEPVEDSDVPW